MPYTVIMQEWVRLNGVSATNIAVQDEENWLDIGGFQAIRPMIQVSHFGGSPVVTLETSPTRDQSCFMQMYNGTYSVSSAYAITAAGVVYGPEFAWETTASPGAPPGKWLRWKVTGGANWSLTFRITLTAAQGRGGSFRHASIPLPEMGRRTAEDHSHSVQGILRARAAHTAALKAATGVGPQPGLFAHGIDLNLDDDRLDQATDVLLAKLGRPATGTEKTMMRSALESTMSVAALSRPQPVPSKSGRVKEASSGASAGCGCDDCGSKEGGCGCKASGAEEPDSQCSCDSAAGLPKAEGSEDSANDLEAAAGMVDPGTGRVTSMKASRPPRGGSGVGGFSASASAAPDGVDSGSGPGPGDQSGEPPPDPDRSAASLDTSESFGLQRTAIESGDGHVGRGGPHFGMPKNEPTLTFWKGPPHEGTLLESLTLQNTHNVQFFSHLPNLDKPLLNFPGSRDKKGIFVEYRPRTPNTELMLFLRDPHEWAQTYSDSIFSLEQQPPGLPRDVRLSHARSANAAAPLGFVPTLSDFSASSPNYDDVFNPFTAPGSLPPALSLLPASDTLSQEVNTFEFGNVLNHAQGGLKASSGQTSGAINAVRVYDRGACSQSIDLSAMVTESLQGQLSKIKSTIAKQVPSDFSVNVLIDYFHAGPLFLAKKGSAHETADGFFVDLSATAFVDTKIVGGYVDLVGLTHFIDALRVPPLRFSLLQGYHIGIDADGFVIATPLPRARRTEFERLLEEILPDFDPLLRDPVQHDLPQFGRLGEHDDIDVKGRAAAAGAGFGLSLGDPIGVLLGAIIGAAAAPTVNITQQLQAALLVHRA